MYRPSLRQLSYLIAIEDSGSFNAAAEECAVTQSTLSAGIKELEEGLQRPLVIRNRKKAALTPFGAEVVQQARQILDKTDLIVKRSQVLETPLSGPLRLGIIPTIAPYVLPDLLPKLAREYPRLELQLFEDITDRLIEKVEKSHIDLALMAFPYETPNLTQLILYDEPFYAAMSEQRDPEKDSMYIKDLEADQLLLLEDGHCLREHALEACDLQDIVQRKTFSATSLPTLIQMVRHGYGMTLLPEMACSPETLAPGVRLIPFKDKHPPTRQIGLCWKRGDPRIKDFETFAETLK
ncbi:MAG: hydrogen peroxide-inducible genes activator [Alphaproteobacteria bacterium]|nr:hydrogen peroxide-inducible genes activator [Alphaproteobacteria bacterium]